jgi:hypothetical protein
LAPDEIAQAPDRDVAHGLAVRIVDRFQMVDVKQRERHRRAVAPRAGELLVQAQQEVPPVGDRGQRVVRRMAREVTLHPADLGGEAHARLEILRGGRGGDGQRHEPRVRLAHVAHQREVAEEMDLRDRAEEVAADQPLEEPPDLGVVGVEIGDHEVDGHVVPLAHQELFAPGKDDGLLARGGDPPREDLRLRAVVAQQQYVSRHARLVCLRCAINRRASGVMRGRLTAQGR